MLKAMESKAFTGIVSPLILQMDDKKKVQSAGLSVKLNAGVCRQIGYGKPACSYTSGWLEVEASDFVVSLVNMEMIKEIGGMVGKFFLYYEDAELGIRARKANWKVIILPQVTAYHSDTTKKGYISTITQYHAARNQIWMEKIHATFIQWLIFLMFSFFCRYPVRLLSLLFMRKWSAFKAFLKGIIDGITKQSPTYDEIY